MKPYPLNKYKFDADQYELRVIQSIHDDRICWVFTCVLYDTCIQGSTYYTSKEEAMNAGRQFTEHHYDDIFSLL